MFSFFLSFPFLSFFCREYTTPWYQFLQASASPNLRSVSISHVENYSESFAFSGTELWGLAAAESRKSVSSKQHWSMIRGGGAATADVLSDLQSSSLSFASLGADLQRTRPSVPPLSGPPVGTQAMDSVSPGGLHGTARGRLTCAPPDDCDPGAKRR